MMAVEMQVSLGFFVSETEISSAHEQLDQVVLSPVTGLQSGQAVLKDLEAGSPL